ncbi:MAG: hypothetical protein A3J10_00955 [Candidatus Sungbacteria bacterium RIFCSPLOWO2_02_FULL_54_10]|nr:MAG: hypothetical protein A3J10_00955 [Candidatus Sungbacteria bacterium RIFCSPLOWO2_02_FULL_54_10]
MRYIINTPKSGDKESGMKTQKAWLAGLFIVIALLSAGVAWAEESRTLPGVALSCLETHESVMVRYHITAIGTIPKVVDILVKEGDANLISRVEVMKATAIWSISEALYRERLAGKTLDTTLKDVDTGATVTRNVFYTSDIAGCGWLFPAIKKIVRVEPFEFFAEEICLFGDTMDKSELARIHYRILAIGAPPATIRVIVPKANNGLGVSTSDIKVVRGVVEWPLGISWYDQYLAGQILDTILQDIDTGAKVTREIRYERNLPRCGEPPILGSPSR